MKISTQKRALFISSNGPEETFGGGQRNILLLQLLKEKGFETDLIIVLNEAWGKYDEENIYVKKWRAKWNVLKIFSVNFERQYLPSMRVYKFIRKVEPHYDVIIFRYEVIAFKSAFYLLNKQKIFIDFDDFILPNKKGLALVKYFPLFVMELLFCKKALYVNKKHASFFNNKGIYLPNLPLDDFAPDDKYKVFQKNMTTDPSVMYVGSTIDDVVDFFRTKAFNELIKKHPNVVFMIVSRSITQEIKNEFNSNHFRWLDAVDNISEIYSKAWISIIPGNKKFGTHIKLIESIFYETPVIATPDSLRGYEFFNMEEILIPVATTHYELASLIDKLILLEHSKLKGIGIKLKDSQKKLFSFNKFKKEIDFV